MALLNLPTRLKLATETSNHYCHDIPAGIPLDVVMSYSYWVHVFDKIRLYDRFEVIALDGTYEAEFRVTMTRPGEMKFRLLSHWAPAENAAAEPIKKQDKPAFVAKFIPAFKTWGVFQSMDGKRMAEGLDRDGAEAEALRLCQAQKAA